MEVDDVVESEASGRYALRGSTLERRTRNPQPTIPTAQAQVSRRILKKGKQREVISQSPEEDTDSDSEHHSGSGSGSESDESQSVDSDIYESPCTPSASIYKPKVLEYWNGTKPLKKRFWGHKKCHPRVAQWQQAVSNNHLYLNRILNKRQTFACKMCAKQGTPCIIFIAITPGCIGCMVDPGKRSCSFVAPMKAGHVQVPYSSVIAMYFHTMVISFFMQGIPLPLAPQSFSGVNFSPGIRCGHHDECMVPKNEVANVKALALERWGILCNADWRSVWYGIPYDVANRAYREKASRKPELRARYANSVWKLEDLPTDYDLEMVTRYYAILDEMRTRTGWSQYDIYQHIIYVPIISALPPSGKKIVRYPPPQARGMSKKEWERHVAGGGDPLYASDVAIEEEDIEEVASIGGEEEDDGEGASESEDEDQNDGEEDEEEADEEDEEEIEQDEEEIEDDVSPPTPTMAPPSQESSAHEDEEDDASISEVTRKTPSHGGSQPKTPTKKRKAKRSAEEWLSPEPSGDTPDSQVRRMMTASQSPQRKSRTGKKYNVPPRTEGKHIK